MLYGETHSKKWAQSHLRCAVALAHYWSCHACKMLHLKNHIEKGTGSLHGTRMHMKRNNKIHMFFEWIFTPCSEVFNLKTHSVKRIDFELEKCLLPKWSRQQQQFANFMYVSYSDNIIWSCFGAEWKRKYWV